MDKYLQQTQKEEVKYWINHNLKNYLKNQPEIIGEIEHIIDYLNSNKAPTRLKKMSYKEANSGAKSWLKTLQKKGNGIVETEDDIKVILELDNGLRLVELKGENAFKREGHKMAHCVSSYYGKSDTKVYSLRDYKNEPHCTMEVSRGDSINQIKGKGNGSIHPKYISAVIKSLEYFGMNVRDSEMVNLGYSVPSDFLFEKLLKEYKNLKYISFNGKNYLYNNQEF